MRTTLITVAVLILLALGYVLSYAPVYRLVGAPERTWTTVTSANIEGLQLRLIPPSGWHDAYLPVQKLTDTPALGEALLSWADLWEVGEEMRIDATSRTGTLLQIPVVPQPGPVFQESR